MGKTRIEYADFVWNVTAGCEKVSPGCEHCYAERMAWRLCCCAGPLVYHHNPSPLRAYKRVVANARWNGNVITIPERLDDPLHWRKPRIVAVNLMADLFHPKVPARFILDVWRIMERCPQHVFLLLTKRAKRMDALLNSWPPAGHLFPPLSNVWPGVTICNQAEADRDLPYLLRCPAAHRWVSIEPCLSAIDLLPYMAKGDSNERQRKGILSAGGLGRLCDRHEGANMEAGNYGGRESLPDPRPFRRVTTTAPSGDKPENGLSDGDVYSGGEAHGGCGASHCVDDCSSSGYSDGDGVKSRRRRSCQPLSAESRMRDSERKRAARLPSAGAQTEGSEWIKECDGEADDIRGARDSASVRREQSDAGSDSINVRDRTIQRISNSPTARLDSGDFIVLGGETGPGARPCLAEWALSIRDQCHASGVPFWLKQIDRFDGRPLPKEMPPELMALRKGKP